MEQVPNRLLTLYTCSLATTTYRSVTPRSKYHRKPSRGPKNLTAMASNSSLAAFNRQRFPLLHLSRHIHDLQIPHRNRQRPRSSDQPVLQTITGSARHRPGQYSTLSLLSQVIPLTLLYHITDRKTLRRSLHPHRRHVLRPSHHLAHNLLPPPLLTPKATKPPRRPPHPHLHPPRRRIPLSPAHHGQDPRHAAIHFECAAAGLGLQDGRRRRRKWRKFGRK